MSDERNTEAVEAESNGERPDLGRTSDALKDALTGSDVGSDTRAGSLNGGSASGSDIDPDQVAINEALASEGMSSRPAKAPDDGENPVNNTGDDREGEAKDGKRAQKDADAATG